MHEASVDRVSLGNVKQLGSKNIAAPKLTLPTPLGKDPERRPRALQALEYGWHGAPNVEKQYTHHLKACQASSHWCLADAILI